MPEGTLTGAGWSMKADSQYATNGMTSAGQVTNAGQFVAAKVRAISGGSSPQIQIRHGKLPTSPIIRSVAATQGATIDQRASPDSMTDGIYLTITGAPSSIDVEVLFR
jgi:hypothetical protein